MPRTESKSFQVHPKEEQSTIDFMQKFGWSLLSSNEIKVKDTHQELRSDGLYSVTETEHYVKLAFSRDLDMPHLKEIKEIEEEYGRLPPVPPLPHFPVWLVIASVVTCGCGLVVSLPYYFFFHKPKKQAAERLIEQRRAKRKEALEKVAQYV